MKIAINLESGKKELCNHNKTSIHVCILCGQKVKANNGNWEHVGKSVCKGKEAKWKTNKLLELFNQEKWTRKLLILAIDPFLKKQLRMKKENRSQIKRAFNHNLIIREFGHSKNIPENWPKHLSGSKTSPEKSLSFWRWVSIFIYTKETGNKKIEKIIKNPSNLFYLTSHEIDELKTISDSYLMTTMQKAWESMLIEKSDKFLFRTNLTKKMNEYGRIEIKEIMVE